MNPMHLSPPRLKWLSRLLLTGSLCLSYTYAEAKPKARAQSSSRRIVSPSSKLRARAAQKKQKAESESPKAGGGKVIEFKQLSVEGTVQRPSASYFLQRRKLKFRGIEPRKSFIPEILSSVKRPPF